MKSARPQIVHPTLGTIYLDDATLLANKPGFTFPQVNGPLMRRLNWAHCGGGPGAFIGERHVRSVAHTLRGNMTSGMFGTDPRGSVIMGAFYGANPAFCGYENWEALLTEQARSLDFVSISAPNHQHAALVIAALNRGVNTAVDKPLTITVEDADAIELAVRRNNLVFGTTNHNRGWPAIILALEMIEQGMIGTVTHGLGAYIQGWLQSRLEDIGQKQAAWRVDPTKSGQGGGWFDIGGSHLFDLWCYVTGKTPVSVKADLMIVTPERKVDDFGTARFGMNDNTFFNMTFSQVSKNRRNDIRLEIYGTGGHIIWDSATPNRLLVNTNGCDVYYPVDKDAPWAAKYPRFKAACYHAGAHDEGWFQAMANWYERFMDDCVLKISDPGTNQVDHFCRLGSGYATIADARRNQYFLQGGLDSSEAGGKEIQVTIPTLVG